MVVVLVIAIFSAIPAWLIFRNQGGVRRGIAAYVAGFLLGVVFYSAIPLNYRNETDVPTLHVSWGA